MGPSKKKIERYYAIYSSFLQGAQRWQIAEQYECSIKTVARAIEWCRQHVPKYSKDQNLHDAIQRKIRRLYEVNQRIETLDDGKKIKNNYQEFYVLHRLAQSLEHDLESLQGLAYYVADSRYQEYMAGEDGFDPALIVKAVETPDAIEKLLGGVLTTYIEKIKNHSKSE